MSNHKLIKIPSGSYAVIFTADLVDSSGYGKMADRMVERAQTMPGFIAVESQRGSTDWTCPGIAPLL